MLVAEVAPRSRTERPSRPAMLRTNSFTPLDRRSMLAPDGWTASGVFCEPPPNNLEKKDTNPICFMRMRIQITADEWRLSNRIHDRQKLFLDFGERSLRHRRRRSDTDPGGSRNRR